MSTLVTGAGGGIGAEVVRQLLAGEESVVAQDLDERRLAELAGLPVTVTVGDLLDDDYRAGLRQLASEAGVTTVIAAHGIDGSGALEQLDDEFVRRVLAVNAATVAGLLEATLEPLRAARGSFVVVASQAGLQAEGDNAAYCAAKFGIVGWVEALAPVLGRDGVALRALCPGCTETPLLFAAQERFAAAHGVSAEEFVAARRDGIPIKRFASVTETAAGAVYLASRSGRRPVILAATGGEVLG